MASTPQTHDLVVIGGSAGSLDALRALLKGLPADMPAAVFIVTHIGSTSYLADILGRVAALPVSDAANGAPFERGHIYVGTPDRHLLLHDNHMLLRRGPRENMARPAIDPLFRSAACSFGSRVIGVVLSGGLNDGTAGLVAIKRCGGCAIVQDPRDAAVPEMPTSALRTGMADHCVPVAEMSDLLVRLVSHAAGETPPIPLEIRLEAAIAAQEVGGMIDENRLGHSAPFSCPECHGTLWEIDDPDVLRYRCRVGHAYTAEAALTAENDEVDRLLWILLRTHEERAALARRTADRERREGHRLADRFAARVVEYDRAADLVRRLLMAHNGAAGPWGGDDASRDEDQQ